MQKFGTSKGFVESVTHVLEGMTLDFYKSLDVKAARKVASCDYEYNTAWGKQVFLLILCIYFNRINCTYLKNLC